jgi:hypothetical protein
MPRSLGGLRDSVFSTPSDVEFVRQRPSNVTLDDVHKPEERRKPAQHTPTFYASPACASYLSRYATGVVERSKVRTIEKQRVRRRWAQFHDLPRSLEIAFSLLRRT